MGKEHYRHGERAELFLNDKRREFFLSLFRNRQSIDFIAFAVIAGSRLATGAVAIGSVIGAGVILKGLVEIANRDAKLDSKRKQDDYLVYSQAFASCLRDISQAVESSRKYNDISFDENIREIRKTLLRLMVDAAKDITKGQGKKICANLMLPEFNQNSRTTTLTMHGFSHVEMGRGAHNPLTVNDENSDFGAVKTFISGKTQYLEDTAMFPHKFTDKAYRSILSYPILLDGVNTVIGIVNIDSETPEAFHDFDDEEVIENLTKIISPWLQAISVTITLQNKESNRVTRTNI